MDHQVKFCRIGVAGSRGPSLVGSVRAESEWKAAETGKRTTGEAAARCDRAAEHVDELVEEWTGERPGS